MVLYVEHVTQALEAIRRGDPGAAGELFTLVYDELRRTAAQQLSAEAAGQTLQPTALVHEAWLRLTRSAPGQQWDSRGHFYAAAAEAMRRILVEAARRKRRIKHGGRRRRLDLSDAAGPAPPDADDLLAVDEALTRLAAVEPQAARLVTCHFFAGLSMEESATALGLSRAGAYRLWAYARAWLRSCLRDGNPESS